MFSNLLHPRMELELLDSRYWSLQSYDRYMIAIPVFQPYDKNLEVLVTNGAMSSVMRQGTIYVFGLELKFILYVLELKCNIFSIGMYCDLLPFSLRFSRLVFREDDCQY